MPATTTLTIRLAPETKARLDRLAAEVRRSRAFLAAEAVEAYVERELAVAEGIARGLRDVAAGRLVPHDEAMAELDALLDAPEGAPEDAAQGAPGPGPARTA